MKFLTSSVFLIAISIAALAQSQTDSSYFLEKNIFYRAKTELFELDGFNHGEMVSPALDILLKKLQEFSLK